MYFPWGALVYCSYSLNNHFSHQEYLIFPCIFSYEFIFNVNDMLQYQPEFTPPRNPYIFTPVVTYCLNIKIIKVVAS